MRILFPEHEIIAGCKKGRRSSQDLLYRQYARPLLGVCMRYLGNQMEAEDVLHDAFIKIFRHIRKFDSIANGALAAWMRRITVNTTLNYIRDHHKYAVEQDISNLEHETDANFDGDAEEIPEIDKELLLQMIQALPQGYKLVFNLYVFENYSHQEIAEALHISLSTSKSQLFKARRLLKGQITAYCMKSLSTIPA
jgi:RNA polymerase sigma factor (sigma-70 family)